MAYLAPLASFPIRVNSGRYIERCEMVGWYDFSQLKDTALKTAISTVIGEYADPRAGAVIPTAGKFFDYSKDLRQSDLEAESAPPTEVIASGAAGEQVKLETREEIWIDYAADVGDGWNSTYAVAYNLAKPQLEIGGGVKDPLKRGEILIFGGDGVYPTANSNEYGKRLVTPYRMAFRAGNAVKNAAAAGPAAAAAAENTPKAPGVASLEEEPHIFVLPGNHDWYDSLVAFRKLFCSPVFNRRKFAGAWRTRQKRSYFALKLPHSWWLLGVDLQLAHNIDLSQLEYFSTVVKEMEDKSRVILCVPEPYWVKAIKYDNYEEYKQNIIRQKEESIEKLEKFFEENEKEIKIKVYIAGDLHHYRRFEDDDRVQKITAGGGGAFLHPTHDFVFRKRGAPATDDNTESAAAAADADAGEQAERPRRRPFFLEKSYPDFEVSRALDRNNLWFFWNNPKFGRVTAVIYALIAWLLHGGFGKEDIWSKDINRTVLNIFSEPFEFLNLLGKFTAEAFWTTVNSLIDTPLATIVVGLLLVGVAFFTDTISLFYKWVAGILHGLSHLIAAFILGWLGYFISLFVIGKLGVQNDTYQNIIWFLSTLLVPAAGGYFVGGIIMGIYLFVSLHFFGRHDNEAFSALKIEDFKNFLRMHIDREGRLTIYPLKIEKVPRRWDPVPDKENPEYYTPAGENKPGTAAAAADESRPQLIEGPIQII